jgi:two-component system response regulator HupR/HoxA
MAAEGRQRPSVLLLEDDTSLAEMVQLALGNEFEIERAATAEEAKLLLAARPFDILLCDHLLPGRQQGLEFLVEAMERYPQARRILMTGYVNADMISRSITVAGLSACVMKPFEMDGLRRHLHESLGPDS